LIPLEQLVVLAPLEISSDAPRVRLDASPWGGGAILYLDDAPQEYFSVRWSSSVASRLRTSIGCPSGQTSWEYLIVLLALLVWASRFSATGVAILGDNLAALNGMLSLRGKNALTAITREVAWRKVRYGWRYAAGHLPSEHNGAADALSRLHAPEGSDKKCLPPELGSASEIDCPDIETIWAC